jgi:para-nitrobenzyl esterase
MDVPLIIGSNNGEGGADGARAAVRLAASGAPAYLYWFTYVPEWRKPARPNGAPHSAELVYVFDSWDHSSARDPRLTAADRTVARKVNSCWVAFARTAPGARDLSCADGFVWRPYDPKADDVVVFADVPSLRKGATIPAGPPQPARTASAGAN